MIQAFGLFGAIGKNALALMAEGQVDGRGNLLANGGVPFDLLADRFHGGVRAKKPVGQRLVLTQKPEEQVFGFDVWTTELAGLVARKKDDPPRFFRVSLEHRV